MRNEAIQQINMPLFKAREALDDIKRCMNYTIRIKKIRKVIDSPSKTNPIPDLTPERGFGEVDEINLARLRSAWWLFIMASHSIYNLLDAGSIGHGKSVAWIGRKKHIRKKDPLLCYIHHARNSIEHTLAIDFASVGSRIIAPNMDYSGKDMRKPFNDPIQIQIPMTAKAGDVVATFRGPTLILLDVKDRGVEYPVPRHHIDKPLENISPLTVASAALLYLEELVNEARTYVDFEAPQ